MIPGIESVISKENIDLLHYAIWVLGLYSAYRVLAILFAKLFDLFASAVLLRWNSRLNCNRTFLSLQDNGGGKFTAKLLKIGWTKAYFVSTSDGELIEMSTTEANKMTKKYKLTKPDDAGKFASLAPGDFGL